MFVYIRESLYDQSASFVITRAFDRMINGWQQSWWANPESEWSSKYSRTAVYSSKQFCAEWRLRRTPERHARSTASSKISETPSDESSRWWDELWLQIWICDARSAAATWTLSDAKIDSNRRVTMRSVRSYVNIKIVNAASQMYTEQVCVMSSINCSVLEIMSRHSSKTRSIRDGQAGVESKL